jgi:hypothetical protein
MNYKAEEKRRLQALSIAGIDTEGFGLLNTFFLHDRLETHFGWLSRKLNAYDFHKLAIYFSDIKTSQHKVKGFETQQIITIKGRSGGYMQDCCIHDQEPEKSISYVCEKYNLDCL